jgi:small subunit ribosomal protein S1
MAKDRLDEQYKEKFRPNQDAALDRQIEDALAGLSDEDLYGTSTPQPKSHEPAGTGAPAKGQARMGKVVSVEKDDVFVDFGGKSQGIVSALQFEQEPKVGEEHEFLVERYDPAEGLLILNRKGALSTNVSWETLEEGQVVEGTVTGVNKGGLELEVKGMRAFMPAGQVDVYHVPDLNQFMGQRIQAEVTQVQREGRNIVLSRRNVVERQRQEQKEKLLAELAPDQIRRGTIRSVMDYGAFVDLGGVDGLLHVSEIAYRKLRNATEAVKVGDVVDVKILKIDRETGKLSLSLKQARGTDPWADAGAKYAAGTQVTGRITKVENFGAFVEVEEGVEGLLPVSEMSHKRIKHPSDVVKEGDTVKLVVLSSDPVTRRMSFSIKQAGPNPWATIHERYVTETVVTGTVSRVVDFGAFIELEPGLEGLVHISELSDKHVRSAADVVKPGQEVKVRILEIDKDSRRIGLSMKRATGALAAAAMTPAEPAGATPAAPPPPKKKRPELRGGLDWNWK